MNYDVYTRDEIDKIGNTIVFLAERISPLPKTKLLKLLFLLEANAVKKWGAPFLNLRFDVWKLGPVSRDIFVELSSEPVLLADFIVCEDDGDSRVVKPKKTFSDDEFNDNEIWLLNKTVEKYAGLTGVELVKLTHNKHTPWYSTAQRNQVLEFLENGQMNTTDFEIDLAELLDEEPEKKAIYLENKSFLLSRKRLKI